MKTTLEIPDELYREVKARAALAGRTVKDLFNEALREKLERERSATKGGWRSVFNKAPKAAVRDLQRIIDDELSTVDPADWR